MLGLTPHLVVPAIFLVLILMAVLNSLLFRPILKVLDDRKGIIEGAARDAGKAAENMGKLNDEYAHALQEAKRDAKVAFNQAHDAALAKEKEILAEAQKKMEKIIDRGTGELEKSVDAAKSELEKSVQILSLEISSKIVGRTLS